MTYEPRTYRRGVQPSGLVSFEVMRAETDLSISAGKNLSAEALALVDGLRNDLEGYIASNPRFAESYVPLEVSGDAPEIVRAMAAGASAASVGPMAAVAGAIAERVALGLSAMSAEVIVENGGDLYVVGREARAVALWAGDSPLTGSVGLSFDAEMLPLAICTSSGRIGHSESFGKADTVTVIARDGALADAVATALGNKVRSADDIEDVLHLARSIEGVSGVVVVVGDRIGAWGSVHLVPLGG